MYKINLEVEGETGVQAKFMQSTHYLIKMIRL